MCQESSLFWDGRYILTLSHFDHMHANLFREQYEMLSFIQFSHSTASWDESC